MARQIPTLQTRKRILSVRIMLVNLNFVRTLQQCNSDHIERGPTTSRARETRKLMISRRNLLQIVNLNNALLQCKAWGVRIQGYLKPKSNTLRSVINEETEPACMGYMRSQVSGQVFTSFFYLGVGSFGAHLVEELEEYCLYFFEMCVGEKVCENTYNIV